MRWRQVALARGWSLDQIPQPRKGLRGPINRHFGLFVLLEPAFALRAIAGGLGRNRLPAEAPGEQRRLEARPGFEPGYAGEASEGLPRDEGHPPRIVPDIGTRA